MRGTVVRFVVLAVMVGAFLATAPSFQAATPATGLIDGSALVQWDFAPVGGPNGNTDTYTLTVKLPDSEKNFYAPNIHQGAAHAAVLTVTQTWTSTAPDQTLSISATDADGNNAGNSTGGAVNDGSDISILTIQNPRNGAYKITASNFDGQSTATSASHAVAKLEFFDLADLPQPSNPDNAPGFFHFHIPLDLMPPTPEETDVVGGRVFGEPSIGVDHTNDVVMYQAGLYTMRATFDDAGRIPQARWANVSSPLTNTFSEDAILVTDPTTRRTWVSQLDLACSTSTISDDDGATWLPAAKACQTPPAVDHQTLGVGPFAPPLPNPGAVYPNAVYYCSQNVAYAACALSFDGGETYGHGLSPMFTSAQCFGLHGHIKVGPDGTLYVPDKYCGAPECFIVTNSASPNCRPGYAVSTDNGQTWSVHVIQDGLARLYDGGDPSVGVGPGGTMYFGYQDRSGSPKIAVCTNQGTICLPSVDVGQAFGIRNTEMAEVVAGDDDRAAFAFLGSTTPGDDQKGNVTVTDASGNVVNSVLPYQNFLGTWHLYISVTYDRGQHWTTTDTTPDHPVERGCIELNANTCPSSRGSDDQRNLLDFNDLTIDSKGRIIAAYTDGCQPDLGPPAKHKSCLNDATRMSGLNPEIEGPALARQLCGKGLYAKFDGRLRHCSSVAEAENGGAQAEGPNTAGAPSSSGATQGAGSQPAQAQGGGTPNTMRAGDPRPLVAVLGLALLLLGVIRLATRRPARG